MNDALSFLRAIYHGNFDAAGVFADWLDERGDPRGKLLRRRWKRWQKERSAEVDQVAAEERAIAAPWLKLFEDIKGLANVEVIVGEVTVKITRPGKADASFRNYIVDRFVNEWAGQTN